MTRRETPGPGSATSSTSAGATGATAALAEEESRELPENGDVSVSGDTGEGTFAGPASLRRARAFALLIPSAEPEPVQVPAATGENGTPDAEGSDVRAGTGRSEHASTSTRAEEGEGTATATAAGHPPDDDGTDPTARTVSKQTVIGASLLALLVAGTSFLLLGRGDERTPQGQRSAEGEYTQDGERTGAVPGAAPSGTAAARPRSSTAATSVRGDKADGKGKSAADATPSGRGTAKGSSSTGADKSGAGAKTAKPATSTAVGSSGTVTESGSGTTTLAVTSLVGSESGRCIDVTDGTASAGTPLQIWDCTGADWQQWTLRSDSTVRALGLCMSVAGASVDDGAAIQLAKCTGGAAQRFSLNSAGDLVNAKADKCVDVRDRATGNGARLQLWSCEGAENQKWYEG
ncbi:ricin-type beta-trefoil lectin domain protein [Streptomyces sp. NPDC050535]|uniref:ricin-type beta-trefoil lectin domain protein n=1 Tax=Streptomyces sp. NPDC050535 TaxID=3365626 RepID=UPI00378D8F8B